MPTSEGALTVTRIVDETLDALNGYVRDQNQATSLVSAIDADDVTIVVAEPNQVSRGLIEIDEELLYVKNVDKGGTVTLMPWGRGQGNTTAVAHAAGARVDMAPLYPRRRVQDAMFSVLREMFPQVYGVQTLALTVTPARTNYTLPSDCYDVLTVETKILGPSQMWRPMRRWRVNRTSTGTEVELLGPFFPGNGTVRVLYAMDLPAALDVTDLSALGYSQNVHDILVLGTTARMLLQTEPARLQVQSVESHGRSEAVPAGSITKVANNLYAMFQQRVRNEADRLQQRYANTPHFIR